MYSISDVKTEVAAVIANLIEARADRIIPEWVTQSVLSAHDAQGVDDFYTVCARAQVRAIVAAHMRDMKRAEEEGGTEQMILEGFECLQEFYMVETQDKQLVSIRIDLCTDEQLLAKAEAIGRVSMRLERHRQEIIRYVQGRRRAAA
jgi:hypothetical protein